jgi:DNA-binding MarR family transcriptional regulator
MPVPKPTLNLDNYLPYLVNRVGAALAARFAAATLEKHGLSIMMWRVLVVLCNSEPQRLIDLCQLASIDQSTLSRMIARLVRRGLVTRKRSKSSDREVAVSLTARGETLVNSIIPIGLAYERQLVGGIPKADLAIAQRVLRRMYANLPQIDVITTRRRGGRGPRS